MKINEHGVVRSTQLSVPEEDTLGALVPSDDGKLYITLRRSPEDPYAVSAEERAKGKVSAIFTGHYIYEFNPGDGSLAGRIDCSKRTDPVRKNGSDFLFLKTRPDDGHFQIIQGAHGH